MIKCETARRSTVDRKKQALFTSGTRFRIPLLWSFRDSIKKGSGTRSMISVGLSSYGSSGSKENLRAEVGSCRRKRGQSIQEWGSALQRLICLIYPEASTDTTEEIGMRAFFDALEDVEMVTQSRYQAPKTLHSANAMAQMVESCRLATGATAPGGRAVHVNKMDAPAFEEVDATPLTPNAVVKAFHTALAPQLRQLRCKQPQCPRVPAKT